MLTRLALFAAGLSAALFTGIAIAGDPPPLCLLDESCAAAPSPSEEPDGPKIGIEVSPYSKNGISGVAVTKDSARRDLWYLTSDKMRGKAKFATGQDVILKVNGAAVRSSSDILKNTHESWNKLTILDTGTRATANYWVDLTPSK